MPVCERPCLDLEAIVPVTLAQPLHAITRDRELARLPLPEHVSVFVQHEPGIFEKLPRGIPQIDPAAAGRGNGARMQPHIQRVLHHEHMADWLAQNGLERHTKGTREGNRASEHR